MDDVVITADGSEIVSANFDDGQLPDGWSIETPGVGWEFADATYFNSNADNAGLSVNELIAEITVEIVIVSANCL